MGVESFFITAKVINSINIDQLKSFLEGKYYNISLYIKRYGGIFPKKIVSTHDIVINNIILCSLSEDDICFQACFSCYNKALALITDIILVMNEHNLIKHVYYGDDVINCKLINKDNLVSLINKYNCNRLDYFLENYTYQTLDLLPSDFYFYYNKHYKSLKKNDKTL